MSKSDRPRVEAAKARRDGELYSRPWPSPFSETWNEGYRDGYDELPPTNHTDKEYREGWQTGMDQLEYDRGELDRVHSSNS